MIRESARNVNANNKNGQFKTICDYEMVQSGILKNNPTAILEVNKMVCMYKK